MICTRSRAGVLLSDPARGTSGLVFASAGRKRTDAVRASSGPQAVTMETQAAPVAGGRGFGLCHRFESGTEAAVGPGPDIYLYGA
ncbi:hypothetical protein FQA47_006127 [Oryzias melastigma]|uniref:Uncharacterized protein n=1 Tax=Oryzias melastigma TaxID=30732 RepID=A0A834F785_ORYME|nr:hypothetical protein FQA47_006127 [Oryzias melastigma]